MLVLAIEFSRSAGRTAAEPLGLAGSDKRPPSGGFAFLTV